MSASASDVWIAAAVYASTGFATTGFRLRQRNQAMLSSPNATGSTFSYNHAPGAVVVLTCDATASASKALCCFRSALLHDPRMEVQAPPQQRGCTTIRCTGGRCLDLYNNAWIHQRSVTSVVVKCDAFVLAHFSSNFCCSKLVAAVCCMRCTVLEQSLLKYTC